MKLKKDFSFIQDAPIHDKSEDILNYNNFAERIVNALVAIPDEGKFVFALCGEWGVGKTSILNLAERKLHKKNFEIIHFNPWNITDKNKLLQEFFNKLKEKFPIQKKKSNFYRLLDKYQNLLIYESKNIPKIGKWISSLINLLITLFVKNSNEYNSITTQKELIITYLQKEKISKKVIIIMDDLDRLTKEEILLVFRLIKEIADFPKISYVLSFDKSQVVQAVGELQRCDGSEYLKKFINLQWTVPTPDEKKLFEVLKDQLVKNGIPINEYQEFIYFEKSYKQCILPFVKTIRDIKLLFNSFIFSYKIIGEEVNLSDLMIIIACSVFFPKLYTFIKENEIQLISYDVYAYANQHLKYLGSNGKEEKNEILSILEEYFKEENCDLAKKILFFLFPIFARVCNETPVTIEKDIDSRNLVQSKLSFSKYFSQTLAENDISMKEVKKIVESASEEETIIYIKSLAQKEIEYSSFISILNEKIRTVKEERLKVLFIALLSGAQIVNGSFRSESTFPISLFSKTSYLCTVILYRLGKERAQILLSDILDSVDLLKIYKGLSDIFLNQYYAFSNNNENYQALNENDFNNLCTSFLIELEKIASNIELIDDYDNTSLFFLIHQRNPDFIRKYFAEIFKSPKESVKVIIAFSGIWHDKSEKGMSAKEFWKTEVPEIPYLQDENLIHNILVSSVFSTLSVRKKEELARYCAIFNIENDGHQSYQEILIEWEKKYSKK